jgi:hypothetical protein
MIIKREITALAAGATLNPNNLWSGSAFEYLKGPSFVSLGIVSLTTFALKGLVSAFYIGSSLIAEEFVVPNNDPAIKGTDSPLISDQFYIQAAGNGGDRVVSTVRNPTAGAITGTGLLQVVPAGGGRGR